LEFVVKIATFAKPQSVFGRKGIFMLNAIASMNELGEVKANMDKVIGSVNFNSGSKHSDFDLDVDQVAAWTIGSLVARKVLAKVGFFAVILKFWKLIAIGFAEAGGTIWKFLIGKNRNEENSLTNYKNEA